MQISDRDPERIQIMFFEQNGILATDESRKAIEKYFNRQELRRALLNQLGDLSFPPRVNEAYISRARVRIIDVDRIRAARFRIALDYGYSGRRDGDAGAASLDAGRVVLHALVHRPGRAGDPGTADLPAFTSQTSRLVEAMGAHLGVVLDRAAERIVLIDEQAREIPADAALHLMIGLVAKHLAGQGRIVIPANVSRVAERIAAAHGVTVERAGITQAGLIEAAADRRGRVRGLARRRLHLPRVPSRLRRRDEHREGARAARPGAQATVGAVRTRCRTPP